MAKSRDFFLKFALCLSIIIIIFHSSVGDDQEGVPATGTGAETIRDRVIKNMVSLSTATSATTTSCWEKAKMAVQQAHSYLFPPTLDFRGSDERSEGGVGGVGGAGKKVKEAVSKSMVRSKSTVEDSAKTAAKFADDAVQKTAETVKKTLSSPEL